MTADTTRREHSGSGIRLGIGSCPGIAKILPAGIRGITLPDGTRVRMLRCVTRENGADIPVALIPATGAVHNRMPRGRRRPDRRVRRQATSLPAREGRPHPRVHRHRPAHPRHR
ncbi:MAG: hypothetical protein ACLUNV_00235 [Sutterella wadsworthensis]